MLVAGHASSKKSCCVVCAEKGSDALIARPLNDYGQSSPFSFQGPGQKQKKSDSGRNMREGIELEAITEDSGFHFQQEDNNNR